MSKHELSLKDVKIPCTIKSLIVEKVYLKTKIYICPLRLEEKLHLIEYLDHIRLLNKTSEFIDHCMHQNKLLLNCFKKTIIWIDTKCLYDLVGCLLYFVFDNDIFLFIT